MMPRPNAPPILGNLPTPNTINTITRSATAQSGWSPNGTAKLSMNTGADARNSGTCRLQIAGSRQHGGWRWASHPLRQLEDSVCARLHAARTTYVFARLTQLFDNQLAKLVWLRTAARARYYFIVARGGIRQRPLSVQASHVEGRRLPGSEKLDCQ